MFAVIAILGLAELFLFRLGWQGQLAWHLLVLPHIVIVSTAALAILLLADNLAVAAIAFLASLATGPFGVLAVAVMVLRPGRNADRNSRDSNSLHRIRIAGAVEREETLYHDIVAGRAYLPAEVPAAISATMRKASPAGRIEILSRAVTAFGRVPAPILAAGIRDENLSVRAAAVAIRSRQLGSGSDRPGGSQ